MRGDALLLSSGAITPILRYVESAFSPSRRGAVYTEQKRSCLLTSDYRCWTLARREMVFRRANVGGGLWLMGGEGRLMMTCGRWISSRRLLSWMIRRDAEEQRHKDVSKTVVSADQLLDGTM